MKLTKHFCCTLKLDGWPRGRALSRLYQLRNSVTEMLLKINSEHTVTFSTDEFQTALAHLVDIFDQYYWLNLKLQGRDANQRRSLGGQWGTYVPGRQGAGAPKWNLQKFHNKDKKPVTSKIAPELR